MNHEPYKRGQVEKALWAVQWLGRIPPSGLPSPPSVFLTRIKRLLDIDRVEELPSGGEEAGARYAFSEEKPGIRGRDIGFSEFDAFSLAIGLELLGTGFNQRDVVVLMRYLRDRLRIEFERLHRIIDDLGDKKAADQRVYAVIQRLELTERFPLLVRKLAKIKKDRRPRAIFLEPLFIRGHEALQKQLHEDMPLLYRTAMLLELSQLATGLIAWLPKTSAARRGPK